MLEINVTLNIPGLPEAINNLANAINGKSVSAGTQPTAFQPTCVTAPQSVVVPESGKLEGVDKTYTESAAPLANPTTAAVPTATNVAPVDQPTPAPATASQMASPSEAKVYTVEQLSVAGAALCEKGMMPQLIALLNKYGVQAVTQLNGASADVLSAFGAELKALGANL